MALSVAVLAVALFALSTALTGSFDAGVVADAPGGLVREVGRQGLAWAEGIRPGQRVTTLEPTDAPGGWTIETTDGTRFFRASVSAAEGQLHWSAIAAVAAAVAAVLSIASARVRRRRAQALAVLGLCFSSIVFLVAQPQPIGSATVLAAGVAPIVAIVRWLRFRTLPAIASVASIAAVGLLWVATTSGVETIDGMRQLWPAIIAIGLVAAVIVGAGVTPRRAAAALAATRTLDAVVAVVAVVAVAAAIVLLVAGLPPVVVAFIVLAPAAVYLRSRVSIMRAIDSLLVGDLRERAGFEAAEMERARLAREIHDSPLQAIAGVIQELERQDGAAGARETLRGVAAQLRSVATDLYPPVLDDLGLAAALEGAARTSRSDGLDVEVAIDSQVGYGRSERPPAAVEIAIFRIVQEALTNAVRHSGATHLAVEGRISPTRIEVAVLDNGSGIRVERVAAAMRAGHLGIASMRRRAESIDAVFELSRGEGNGTRVRVRWSA